MGTSPVPEAQSGENGKYNFSKKKKNAGTYSTTL
jgi:hypothetical protein